MHFINSTTNLLRRFHLIEFEDLESFPACIRDGITDYLRFVITTFRMYEPVTEVLKRVIEKSGKKEILDLCSGGSGSLMRTVRKLDEITNGEIKVTMSDKFPNIAAYRNVSKSTNGRIEFIETPVDASNVPSSLNGIRTIFSSFHHFDESEAKAVLKDAVDKKSPICIFDGAERKLRYAFAVLLSTPVGMPLFTPFYRPFSFKRLFFTYIIPLIILFGLWDGVVSMLRIYEPDEMLKMANEIDSENYEWESGKLKAPIGTKINYLVGIPK